MSKIHIKLLSENALAHMKKNIDVITKMIKENDSNEWIYSEFPEKMFIEKKYEIDDFSLADNPESNDKGLDLANSITIYESLKSLPRYVLTDERFWLWLHLEKFYKEVKSMMTVNGKSTILDHWMHKQGTRRGLMFGVLSRCYFRVALTVDESLPNKYELTNWVIENPERFRNLTWRSFSSEEHLVRGIIKGEKKVIDANPDLEKNSIYPEIAKYVSIIGSVRLLDIISEEDIAAMICEKTQNLIA